MCYGSNSIDIAESFFYIDSFVTLKLLGLIDGEEGDRIRWQFAVRSVDDLLNNFNFSLDEKLFLLEQLNNGFVNEHGGTKELKLQLNNKFRSVRKNVEDILNIELDETREILPLIELLVWKKEQIAPLVNRINLLIKNKQLKVNYNGLLASYIHMMLNRIFMARQRTCEMVVYDLLYKYYKSMIAREKCKIKTIATVSY